MGLFDSISKFVTGIVAVPVSAIAKAFGATPEQISKGITKTQESTIGKVLSTVAVVAGSATAILNAPKIISAAKILSPTTVKGKIIAAVAVPVVAGAIIKEPEKTISTIVKAPGELAQFGGDVATFASSPSLESAKEIISESPLISSALAVGGIVAVGKSIIPAIATSKQTTAIIEQTKAIESATLGSQTNPIIIPGSAVTGTTQTLEKSGIIMPETTDISAEKAVTAEPVKNSPIFRNNIHIKINNRAVGSQRRYLNQVIYA